MSEFTKEDWAEEMRMDAAEEMQEAKQEAELHKNFDYAMQRLVIDSDDLEEIRELISNIQKTLSEYGWEIEASDIVSNI